MSLPEQEQTPEEVVFFHSLTTMRDTHKDLLVRRSEEGDTAAYLNAVQSFLRRGQGAGAYLDKEADREAAQSMLDYWENFLFHAGWDPELAMLADFDITLQPEIPESKRPYVGLSAFSPENRQHFYGRSQLIKEILAQMETARFTAVAGPSGSGKSSVVMAGLLPALQRGNLLGSENWRYLPTMVPGSTPLARLARVMKPEKIDDATAVADWMLDTIDAFHVNDRHLVELADTLSDGPVLLIIDQFEELFTLCYDEEERAAFIANILNLAQARAKPHRVIITMRTDYESYLSKHALLLRMFEQGEVRVTAMTAAELRKTIEGPAEAVGLKFDEGLVDQIVREILGEPAALPLLQFALMKLWEKRQRNRITWKSYRQIGNVSQALANTADDIYDSLLPEEKVTARRIFMRIVRPSAGLEVTRNRIRRRQIYQSGEAVDRVDRVLTRLIEARLIRLTSGATPEDDQLEVAHEALVRNWPLLVSWLDEERVRLRQRYQLSALASEWDQRGRDESLLLRGDVLREAQQYDDLNPIENAFVQTSREARRKEERAERERLQQEKEQAEALATEKTKAARRLLYFNIALVAAVVGLIFGVIVYTNLQQEEADGLRQALALANANATATVAANVSTIEARQAQSTITAQAVEATEAGATRMEELSAATAESSTRSAIDVTATAELATSQAQAATQAALNELATTTAVAATSVAGRATAVVEQTAIAQTRTVSDVESPQGTELTEEELVQALRVEAQANSVIRPGDNMPMLYVTEGEFTMGALDSSEGAAPDEQPTHDVTLAAFYIDQYEVSVQQYAKFINALEGYRSTCNDGQNDCVFSQAETQYTFLLNNRSFFEPQAGFGNYPINWVTWYGANDYCRWVGGRLPTEAEWEYAARSIDGRIYPWGDSDPSAVLARYGRSLQVFDTIGPTVAVTTLEDGVGPFTNFNMAGNVAEWVADWYVADAYERYEGGRLVTDDSSGEKVLRGGYWGSSAEDIRTTARWHMTPAIVGSLDNNLEYAGVGFRCAFDVANIEQ